MRFLLLLLCVSVMCGCGIKSGLDKKSEKTSTDKKEVAKPEVQQKPAEPQKGDGKGIIGKSTSEVLDYRKAKAENPNFIDVDPTPGGDYLTFVTSSYIDLRSKASMLGMQQQLQLIKQGEGRNPTYAEIMKIMKENGIQFTMLRRYQKYSYDEKDGKFIILEDPTLRPKP